MRLFSYFLLLCGFTTIASAMPLSDIFIATEAEAKALRPEDQPLSKYPGADIKGVDEVKLEHLLSMVESRRFDPKSKGFPLVAALSDEGPWILRISPALEQFFAGLDEKQIVSWGEKWAQIEEFKLDRFKQDEVAEVVRVLARLSREARHAKKALFLWMMT